MTNKVGFLKRAQYCRSIYHKMTKFLLTINKRQKQPSEVFCKKGILINFAIFTGKKPVLESPFNKITGLKACNFIKKRLQHRRFLVNIVKFLRISILQNIYEQLLQKRLKQHLVSESIHFECLFLFQCVPVFFVFLPISAQCCISYRNQSFDLQCISYRNQSSDLHCKSNDCFLHEMQHWAELGEIMKTKVMKNRYKMGWIFF